MVGKRKSGSDPKGSWGSHVLHLWREAWGPSWAVVSDGARVDVGETWKESTIGWERGRKLSLCQISLEKLPAGVDAAARALPLAGSPCRRVTNP